MFITDNTVSAYLFEIWDNWRDRQEEAKELACKHHLQLGEVAVKVGRTTHFFSFRDFFARLDIHPDQCEGPIRGVRDRAFWQDALDREDAARLKQQPSLPTGDDQ
jgi:hypothetical protein